MSMVRKTFGYPDNFLEITDLLKALPKTASVVNSQLRNVRFGRNQKAVTLVVEHENTSLEKIFTVRDRGRQKKAQAIFRVLFGFDAIERLAVNDCSNATDPFIYHLAILSITRCLVCRYLGFIKFQFYSPAGRLIGTMVIHHTLHDDNLVVIEYEPVREKIFAGLLTACKKYCPEQS
jgi:hypothetical protein